MFLPLLIVFVAVAGCSKTDPCNPIASTNQPPTVELIAEPIRHEVERSVATFGWVASDPDGEVVGYRYAVDRWSGPEDWFETTESSVTLSFSAPESSTQTDLSGRTGASHRCVAGIPACNLQDVLHDGHGAQAGCPRHKRPGQ